KHAGVSFRSTRPGILDHRLVELAPRREDARRVDEDDLAFVLDDDGADPAAGGLHLVRHDGELAAGKLIEKCGLAGVGRPDDGAETAAGFRLAHDRMPSRLRKAEAAACSAERLVGPSPIAAGRPWTFTSTAKTGAW